MSSQQQGSAPLGDESLAQVLTGLETSAQQVLVIANSFTARVATGDPTGSWTEVGRGDFGLRCGAAAKAIAKARKLSWLEVTESPAATDLSTATGSPVTVGKITAWLKSAEALTTATGRGDAPEPEELRHLGYQAGWRCQFAGCGEDLKRTRVSGTPSNSSYFAHIIASSPNGPRGDRLMSGQRADDIDNIMLMCDQCHRRIDRVDPDRFTVEVLQKMRRDSIKEVRRLLDTLKYQEAVPIVVMGNITAQAPRFIERHADEAMWTRKLRMRPRGPEHYFDNGWRVHDPHTPHYWASLFDALRGDDIPLLRKRLNGTSRDDGTPMPLAVFPLHGTSLLVLAGRLVGEGSSVTVFQYSRDRPADAPGGKWAFDESVPAPAPGKYCINVAKDHSSGDEAVLLVSLTFQIDHGRLPKEFYDKGNLALSALEVTVSDSNDLKHSVIGHPADLDLLSLALEDGIRMLQDGWGVSKVHLFIGAPASACFRIGQKLQARHHATVVCYETAHGPGSPFLPTIEISNDRVRELQTNTSISLT